MKKLKPFAIIAATILMLALPYVALAQTLYSIEPIGSRVGLGEADLKNTVINIIRWILGILALLAVVFVIYGGFMWLTSGGDESKIEKAKKIISGAVVGLIIVILAWAIVIFVARTTSNVTQP